MKLVRNPASEDDRFAIYVYCPEQGSTYTLESEVLIQYVIRTDGRFDSDGGEVEWDHVEAESPRDVRELRQIEYLLREAHGLPRRTDFDDDGTAPWVQATEVASGDHVQEPEGTRFHQIKHVSRAPEGRVVLDSGWGTLELGPDVYLRRLIWDWYVPALVCPACLRVHGPLECECLLGALANRVAERWGTIGSPEITPAMLAELDPQALMDQLDPAVTWLEERLKRLAQ